MSEVDEEKIATYFSSHGLSTTRFSKNEQQSGKTPDFRASVNGNLIAYCEVKSIVRDSWLVRLFAKAVPGKIVGGLRDDPVFNRLTDDVHTAAQQFDAVNLQCTVPNILALVNHDRNCGFLDLLAILTGNFIGTEGTIPIYRRFSEGRIHDEKSRIHLYIWLDDFRPTRLLFSRTNLEHHCLLCHLFGFDDTELRNIDS